MLVSARISRAFLRRVGRARRGRSARAGAGGDQRQRRSADARAGRGRLGIDLAALAVAESAGLVTLHAGVGRVPPPAGPLGDLRRRARRGAARRPPRARRGAARPGRRPPRMASGCGRGRDRRRGIGGARAGGRARAATAARTRPRRRRSSGPRGSPPTPSGAPGCCSVPPKPAWHAGLAERAGALLEEARACTADPGTLVAIDQLARPHRDSPRARDARVRDPDGGGRARRSRARRRDARRGRPRVLLRRRTRRDAGGGRAGARRAARGCHRYARASWRTWRWGWRGCSAGDAAAGAEAMHEAVALADGRAGAARRPAAASVAGARRRSSCERPSAGRSAARRRRSRPRGTAPRSARSRSVLNLIARDQATTDRWAVAEATYQEAIGLARETDQRTDLGFGLAGLAWLQARRGREERVPGAAPPRRSSSAVELGARLHEVWATAALGELELGLGDAGRAGRAFRGSAASAARARDHRRRSLSRG